MPYEISFLQLLLKMIKYRFLLLAYLVTGVRVETKECLCPQKGSWPVPYNSQMFCGKELMILSPNSECQPEQKYFCERQQIIATGDYDCEEARYKFCSPKLERHCPYPNPEDKRLFETCMKERACMRPKFADANMKATYGNISKSH
jgi:hypothetical protein